MFECVTLPLTSIKQQTSMAFLFFFTGGGVTIKEQREIEMTRCLPQRRQYSIVCEMCRSMVGKELQLAVLNPRYTPRRGATHTPRNFYSFYKKNNHSSRWILILILILKFICMRLLNLISQIWSHYSNQVEISL